MIDGIPVDHPQLTYAPQDLAPRCRQRKPNSAPARAGATPLLLRCAT